MAARAKSLRQAIRLVDYRLPIGEYGRLVLWVDNDGYIHARIDEASRRDEAYRVRLESTLLDNSEGCLPRSSAIAILLTLESDIHVILAEDAEAGDEVAQTILRINAETTHVQQS